MKNIVKCKDNLCPSKKMCYRYTKKELLSYGIFNREDDAYNCIMFLNKKPVKQL